MAVQVLVAAMNQNDHSLLERMRINSDVIVGNQCDRNLIEKFEYLGHSACYLNFHEKGVGLNRNNAILRATGEFCIFADDDVIFANEYANVIENAFRENPTSDVIIFNIHGRDTGRNLTVKRKKICRLNYLKYGTVRIAFRLKSVRENGIFFNLCYGGGASYSHGEDNLFLATCLDKGLKIIAVPDFIGSLADTRVSSWNSGYHDKYLYDQGKLYHAISRRWWLLLIAQDAIRRSESYQRSPLESARIMISGARDKSPDY